MQGSPVPTPPTWPVLDFSKPSVRSVAADGRHDFDWEFGIRKFSRKPAHFEQAFS